MYCKICTRNLTPGDFYPGVPSYCKECHKAKVKRNRLTNPSVRAYDRMRAKRPERIAKAAVVTTRWRAEHPEAYKAQNSVNNALRDGKIIKQPCCMCATTEHVHAHHCDYSRPLDVKWLCAKCHHRLHAQFPELGGHFEAAE